ncbi:2Fe-2S iron-sulfur cluster-binding protein [Haloferula chungangensis]|uniref:2Fe-2S iron-sulfur cluster-binding protein n=1 Tax=Haloferula chungangensis TaxID=1048331 RepID=A0ABW2L2Q9_9BACT
MSKVTFIKPDGEEIVIENASGTLMEIATENDIEGIDGACGGVCSCATCHVRVKAEWLEKVGKPDETEQDILSFETESDERSRLCCQIEMSDELDGLVVEVAPLN